MLRPVLPLPSVAQGEGAPLGEQEIEQSGQQRKGRRIPGVGERIERTRKPFPAALMELVEIGGPLIEGTTLMCPACEERSDILTFIPLEHSVKYADQIVVPLKCRSCRHVFALRP